MKRGLVLEGGGAKGSYHIGVYKAYIENGYLFDGFVGTSIGAINAAMLASGDFENAINIWMDFDTEDLFDKEVIELLKLNKTKLDKNFPGNITAGLKKIIVDRGIDHSKMKKFLSSCIDENRVRKSGATFGLVTFSLDEKKPYEVFLEDIPHGKLIDYILASARLPVFTTHTIDNKRFIDGAVYNNCPINMLIDKNYDEIIVVKTNAFGIVRKFEKTDNITIIQSNEHLGQTLDFSTKHAKINIERGYYDGLRAIQKLAGNSYYLKNVEMDNLIQKMLLINDKNLNKIEYFDNLKTSKKRILLEKTIPDLASFLNLKKEFTYEEFILALLEFQAIKKEIYKYDVYEFNVFCKLIKTAPTFNTEKNILDKVGLDFKGKKEKLISDLIDILL